VTSTFGHAERNEILLQNDIKNLSHMIRSIFQKMLHDIVSIFAIAELFQVILKLDQNRLRLVNWNLFQDLLKDSASKWVKSQFPEKLKEKFSIENLAEMIASCKTKSSFE